VIATETVLQLATGLALGLLIGLERGWHEREAEEGMRVAGVRTFGLIGLLGGFAGLLAAETQLSVIGYAFVGLAAILVAGHVMAARRRVDAGITSLVAALLTFALGAAATRGYMAEAAMAAVTTALLLGYKSLLHRWVSALEPEELHAALKLLAISVIVLPLLPDRGFGPWQALNPFKLWWMVVLIAGISFCGYFAMKIAGDGKGALLTGLFAGLASSTALTLHFSRLARSRPGTRDVLAAGILIACGTMFPRMLIVASLVHRQVFHVLLLPALAMAAVVYAGAGVLWWRSARHSAEGDSANLRNPLEFRSAVLFGALLAFILVAARGLEATFGEAGLLVLAGISGIADVDAITLTLAKMGRSEAAVGLAGFCIVLAGAVNSLVKGAMTMVIGGTQLATRVAAPLALAAGVGLLIAWNAPGIPDVAAFGN
jgi:uncharacterized membrane protein (DUF4010 family)